MIAWKSLQLLLLCAIMPAWSNAQAQEAKPNGSQLQPVYSPANPKGGWKVKTQETRGAYSVLESIVQPSTGPEPHRHSREDEGFYIIEGQYEFRVGTQVINAAPGDFLFAPRNVPHTYKNVGTTPSRHLTIISPGGLESFFAERAALQKETPPPHPACQLRLNEQTSANAVRRSRLCQKPTSRSAATWSLFDHLVGAGE
jgi:quercetin dioxygenase-like cupin family protein